MSSRGQKAIAITVGDPAGIGPEVVAKSIAQLEATVRERLIVICHESWFAKTAASLRCEIEGVHLEHVDAPIEEPGKAALAYLERAASLANNGVIQALVTAPIHKARIKRAGFSFPGHTEFLADRLGAKNVAMMFVGPTLRIVLTTIHLPLSAVPSAITTKAINSVIDLGVAALRDQFNIKSPRLGVLGLNPHAGESGVLGREEIETIGPAIEAARKRHPSATLIGPLVPDAAYRETADLFVAMYHDQALIPLKLVDFDRAVNVTLGLPIIRTSPDHGTADDIAGKNIARHESFTTALELALVSVGLRPEGLQAHRNISPP